MSETLAVICDGTQQDVNDLALAKLVSEELTKHYPGHVWAVNVQSQHGVITVKNMNLSGNRGFLLHYRNMKSYDEVKRQAMWAGGEILERYQLSRGRFNMTEYRGLKQSVPGRFVHV